MSIPMSRIVIVALQPVLLPQSKPEMVLNGKIHMNRSIEPYDYRPYLRLLNDPLEPKRKTMCMGIQEPVRYC